MDDDGEPGVTTTDALVLRQRVAPGEADAVRELVADQFAEQSGDGRESADGSPAALVGDSAAGEGVRTASLFLDRARDEAPDLVWYLEVEDAERGPWADPASALVGDSPLFDAGLGDRLETPDSARVFADDSAAASLLVHATLPDRPASVRAAVGADSGDSAPDVVLLRLRVKPGLGDRFVRALAGLTNRLSDDGVVERKFEEWTRPVLEAEGMWTESIFLERTDGDYFLLWYMEAEDMAQVGEAYYETDNPVARASEVVLGRILTNPRRALADPVAASDHELLAHAASSERA